MIKLYSWGTPNGWKVSATLEELNLDYEVVPVDISQDQQKTENFLAINPNGKIPAIVDTDADDFTVFESGACMIYLAEKAGRLLPEDPRKRSEVLQWLMFQMAAVGPMQGQANVFYRYFPEKIQPAIDRYQNETRRLYEVLNARLKDRTYICDNFSIADIAHWAWIRVSFWAGIDHDDLSNLNNWLERVENRPACARGANIPNPFDIEEARKTVQQMDQGETTDEGTDRISEVVKNAQKMVTK